MKKTFKITVNPAPVPPPEPDPVEIITESPLPDGEVGAAYSETLEATGGDGGYLFTLASGSLPHGLSLDAAGKISGVPTAAGTTEFEIEVVVNPVPPPGASEPMPDDPGASIIWSENFDSYKGIHALHPTQNQPPLLHNGSGFGRFGLGKGLKYKTLVPGRNGGKALKFTYSNDPALGCDDILISKGVTKVTDFFIQYWFKTTPGHTPTEKSTSGVKWLMLWNDGNQGRYQHDVTRIAPYECESSRRWSVARMRFGIFSRNESWANYVWGSDPCLPPPFDSQDAADTPWPNGLNDGSWHRVTIHLKVGSYVKGWLDGVLVWDDEGGANTYSPRVTEWKMFGNFTDQVWTPDLFEVFLDDVYLWTVEEG